MSSSLHVVLGASGSIGQAVIHELGILGLPVRAVGRRVNIPGVENHQADLLDAEQARAATDGASHVYLCVGLPYRSEVWERDWEIIMGHTIAACQLAGARLIFLDNIYMYGPAPLQNPITEAHPQAPMTRKGRARKRTADLLLRAFESGKLQGLIGRAADIYGPLAVNSPLYISVLDRMLQGKSPQLISPPDVPHRFACTTDLGRALVALALDETTYGEVWHLPVGPLSSMGEMITTLNTILGTDLKPSVLPGLLRKILGLFISPLREASEMRYQFEQPYHFSAAKFHAHFPAFQITPYAEGLAAMVRSFQGNVAQRSNL